MGNQPINLANAVQVSIDIAMQSCEVKKPVEGKRGTTRRASGGGGKDCIETP